MESWQFETLMKMTGLRQHSMAALGAQKVLVDGLTSTDAAEEVGVETTTVSRAVARIMRAKEIADYYVARSVEDAVKATEKK